MARHETHLRPQRPEFLRYRVEELLVVAARKIGPSDRTTKQDIPDKGEPAWLVIDHDMAGRVPRRVHNSEALATQFQRIAFIEIPVRHHITAIGNAVLRTLRLDLIEQPLIILVRSDDRRARAFLDLGGCASMIEMAMRQPDFLDRHAKLARRRHQPVRLTARIDENPFPGRSRPDQRGVLLQWRHRNDPDFERGLRRGFCHSDQSVDKNAEGQRFPGTRRLGKAYPR